MVRNILAELYQDLFIENPLRLKYTRKAFLLLPELNRPCILDVGCGRGEVTLELAKWSRGEVIALDIHQPSLEEITKRAEEAGLSDHIKAVNGSMLAMDFPEENFDIIWAEGSIHVIGFEKGLKEWRRLVKPDGFLVVHEMTWLQPNPPQEILDHWRAVYPGIRTALEYVEQIPRLEYELITYFTLPERVWWNDYYDLLQKRINRLRKKYAQDEGAQKVLDKQEREIELYQRYSKWYGSAFYVMQKVGP